MYFEALTRVNTKGMALHIDAPAQKSTLSATEEREKASKQPKMD